MFTAQKLHLAVIFDDVLGPVVQSAGDCSYCKGLFYDFEHGCMLTEL